MNKTGKKKPKPKARRASPGNPARKLRQKPGSFQDRPQSSQKNLLEMLEQARRILKLDGFLIWRRAKGKEFTLLRSSLKKSGWVAKFSPDAAGLSGLQKKPGELILNLGGRNLPARKFFSRAFQFQPKSIAAASFGKRNQILLICVLASKKRELSRKDLGAFQTLLPELTLAAENARLEKTLREEVEQTGMLLEINRILNSSLEPKTVRTRAMEAVVRLLDCQAGSLYLIDAERGELYFEVVLSEVADKVKEIRLKIGEGVAGWVAQTGECALIADTEKDPRWASKVDRKSKFHTRNMVTVPVQSKGKIIGVLQAINKLAGKVFDREDLKLMTSLADQVAIALENAFLYQEQRVTFFQTAEALALAIEKRDIYTGGHTKRVRDFSVAIGRELGLTPEEREKLELSAILHDIGKIGIEDRVLRKPGKLDDEEFAQMRTHPEQGYEILSHIKNLEQVIPGTRYHHERLDGRGYPLKLTGEQIPLIARIIAVADTWDAMTSDRPYRAALDEEKALTELWQNRGNQLSPEAVEAFFKAYRQSRIYTQHRPKGSPAPESGLALLTSLDNQNKLGEQTGQKGGV